MPTILDIVVDQITKNGEFELLGTALSDASLLGAVSDTTVNYTVFAPTDEAFVGLAKTLGYGGSDEAGAYSYIVDSLTVLSNGNPITALTDVLLYHVFDGQVVADPTKFPGQDVTPIADVTMATMLQGGVIEPDLTQFTLFDEADGISDPKIAQTDIDASNGVIHVIAAQEDGMNGVLLPQLIVDALSAPGTDIEVGDGSNEVFRTGRGNDIVNGNGGNDLINTGSGNDLALGGDGSDKIFGRKGNDILRGEDGRDKIFGGSGKDVIEGGAGIDWLSGGRGHDTFVFENGSDYDIVTDFRNGKDQIDLSGYMVGDESITYSDLNIIGGFFSSRIELEDGDNIRLLGVRKSQLDQTDFIFADDLIV